MIPRNPGSATRSQLRVSGRLRCRWFVGGEFEGESAGASARLTVGDAARGDFGQTVKRFHLRLNPGLGCNRDVTRQLLGCQGMDPDDRNSLGQLL